MLNICESNDELASILGHEMAHAVLGHGVGPDLVIRFTDFRFGFLDLDHNELVLFV